MLTHLSIQGLAIIDSLAIELSPGFNVITGETGAGKSILIRGLNYLMGAKSSPEDVRRGFDQAIISGQFIVPNHHPAAILLGNLGVPLETHPGGGVPIIIRRQITAKGRSQSWVNDVALTSAPLRELGAALVDVFSQHENQRLLEPSSHMRYLDRFLKDEAPKIRVKRLFDECSQHLKTLQKLVSDFESRGRDHDYLQFRMEALEKFSPSKEDYDRIEDLLTRAKAITSLQEPVAKAAQCLVANEGDPLGQRLRECAKILSRIPESDSVPQLAPLSSKALELAEEIDNLSFELETIGGTFEVDGSEIDEAHERLFAYQDLFRKHNVRTVDDLIAETTRIKEELGFLEAAQALVATAMTSLDSSSTALQEASKTLSALRLKAGASAKKKIESELHELAMGGARFEVEFNDLQRNPASPNLTPFGEPWISRFKSIAERLSHLSDDGSERAQFLLASNPGEPALPLARIASGGELSRTMLAFKKSLAADADTCVLVFDEIDSGISGRVADVVGKKMRELANGIQLICISHLPQVAVYADSHFLVQKGGKGKRTETQIIRLTEEESANEIARLLSGAEVSKPSLANAKALMEKARSSTKRTKELRVH